FFSFVRNYNMHNMGKTIDKLHDLLIEYEKGLPKRLLHHKVMVIQGGRIQKANKKSLNAKGKGKGKGKGKEKPFYISKPKNPKPSAKDHPKKDDACHHCKEVGHYKRNDPVYFADLIEKRKQVGTASSSVSKNNVLYFNVIINNGIYEIDMINRASNVNSIYTGSNKRAKHNLDSTYLWHCRLAHISKKCKMTRKSFPYRTERATDLLGIIHTDVCGPLRHVSRQDRGGEYISKEFKDYMKACGIVQQLTPLYTPQHNGVSEKRSRTLLDMVRSMMNLTTLSGCEALVKRDTPDRLQQRPVKCIFVGYLKETMGYYFYFLPENKIIVARAIRILISIAAFYDYEIWQMDVKSAFLNGYIDEDIYMRYKMDNSKRGHILMQERHDLNKIQGASTPKKVKCMQNVPYAAAVGSIMSVVRCTTPDVTFAQNITSWFQQNPEAELRVDCYCDAGFETDRDDTKSQTGYVFILNGGAMDWKSSKQSTTAMSATEAEYIAASEAAMKAVWIKKFILGLDEVVSNEEYIDSTQTEQRVSHSEPVFEPVLRRSQRVPKPNSKYMYARVAKVEDGLRETDSYHEASENEHGISAMKAEMDALVSNQTWELVQKPPGVKPMSSKWVYKVKQKVDGTVDRYKARLVARGCSQQVGLDYEDTFSPVAKITTIRVLLALAASKGQKLWQMDVHNAFLYEELDHVSYMMQPMGFESQEHPEHVCKLKKAIYGLKQSPRAWFGKIAEFLEQNGYQLTSADASLFVKKLDEKILFILVQEHPEHVCKLKKAIYCLKQSPRAWFGKIAEFLEQNGYQLTSADASLFVKKLDEKILFILVYMKDLGRLKHFLGLEINYTEGAMILHQMKYTVDLLHKFHVASCKPVTVPMDRNVKLYAAEGKKLDDPTRYRKMPFHARPKKEVLKYIKATVGKGLRFGSEDEPKLTGYCDANYVSDVNTRRSTTGYVFLYGSSPVSWCSKRQPTLSLSTTEAEYQAAAMAAAQECVWLVELLRNLNQRVVYPVQLWCDNISAIKLAQNPVFHARTKHIEVHYHFIREKVLNEEISLEEISSEEQVADALTKGLTSVKMKQHSASMGMVDHDIERGC
nr:hypothetical protein [Tanacetum cinerariifolium]